MARPRHFDDIEAPPFDTWPIGRGTPDGPRSGVALSTFTNNGTYYYDSVDVYEDGAVGSFELLDLELFRKKMETGSIVTAPPPGSRLSFGYLGSAEAVEAEWTTSRDAILPAIDTVLRTLNPEMKDLFDLEGSSVAGEDEDGRLEMKMPLPIKVALRAGEKRTIPGHVTLALRRDDDRDHLVRVIGYADGQVRIGDDPSLISLEDLHEVFATGRLATTAPAGRRIDVPGLGWFVPRDDFGAFDPVDLIGELVDANARFHGEPSAVSLCLREYRSYRENPTEAHRERLRDAYERVPKHLRQFCGDMDSKDYPIRKILYGDAGSASS